MPNEIEQAYRYCESVTRRHAKSFYFAARFLPKAKQSAVFPIYAFCRHVDDEIDEITDGDEARAVAAVERWRANLNFIYDEVSASKFQIADSRLESENQRPATEDQRPATEDQKLVFLAWRDLLTQYKIPQKLPLELIEGVVQDTFIKRYETFDELYVYCYRVASTVGLMSSEILGYSAPEALDYAEAMGIGMQLTNILRDIKEDAAMGRIYLPAEDLKRFGVTEEQIIENKLNADFVRLLKFEISRARDYYRKGERGIAMLEKDSRFTVLLAARVYAKILDEIERLNYDVFARRAHTSKAQKLISIPKIWMQARRM